MTPVPGLEQALHHSGRTLPKIAVTRAAAIAGPSESGRFPAHFLRVGYFFWLPILAVFQPEFEVFGLLVNFEMIAAAAIFALFLRLAFQRPAVWQLSPLSTALFVYNAYFLGNSLVRVLPVEVTKTESFLIVASSFTVVLIESLPYVREDLTRLLRSQRRLAWILLAGTLLQVFVDPSLFVLAGRYEQLLTIDFEGFWRYGSIFDSMMENQGGIAFIMLTFIIAFYRTPESRMQRLLALGAILAVGFLSASRYIILLQLVGLMAAVGYRAGGDAARAVITTLSLAILGVAVWLLFGTVFVDSDFFNVRLMADVSGRTTDPMVFLTTYAPTHPIVFGTGFSSFDVEYYYPGLRRIHAGFWDLLFQGGIVGIALFCFVLYRIQQWAMRIYRAGGSPMTLLVAPTILAINLTARLNTFVYWGYFLAFFVMALEEATTRASRATRPVLIATTPARRPLWQKEHGARH